MTASKLDVGPAPSIRLGSHHFAYLRAIAEGLAPVDAAKRYLGIEHRADAVIAHRLVVERVRALARRRGDARWRLIGLDIRDPASALPSPSPSLYEWAESEGLGDWAEVELRFLYGERFGTADVGQRRRLARNARLRERRLELLRSLEAVSAESPAPTDKLAGWLPAAVAEHLHSMGDLTLGDLKRRIARGGRWWGGMPAFGPTKAARLATFVEALLGRPTLPDWSLVLAEVASPQVSGRGGAAQIREHPLEVGAQSDRQAIQSWIEARTGSPATARQYEREAERWQLWCLLERGKAMSVATAEDCRDYLDFLGNIPERWISRRRAGRLQVGWAPFRGPLSHASRRVALEILTSLFTWLVHTRYVTTNPWLLLDRAHVEDPHAGAEVTLQAFTPAAWADLLAQLGTQAPSPASDRLRWLCIFVRCVGLRPGELLRARREHLHSLPEGWVLRVPDKGRKERLVPVPAAAMSATRSYFSARGLDFDAAPPDTPLLASLLDPNAAIGYQALHQTFTRFVRRALVASKLSAADREHASRASAQWLRHTYATDAVECEVPPKVLQENLGQSDSRATARYYLAKANRRRQKVAIPTE